MSHINDGWNNINLSPNKLFTSKHYISISMNKLSGTFLDYYDRYMDIRHETIVLIHTLNNVNLAQNPEKLRDVLSKAANECFDFELFSDKFERKIPAIILRKYRIKIDLTTYIHGLFDMAKYHVNSYMAQIGYELGNYVKHLSSSIKVPCIFNPDRHGRLKCFISIHELLKKDKNRQNGKNRSVHIYNEAKRYNISTNDITHILLADLLKEISIITRDELIYFAQHIFLSKQICLGLKIKMLPLKNKNYPIKYENNYYNIIYFYKHFIAIKKGSKEDKHSSLYKAYTQGPISTRTFVDVIGALHSLGLIKDMSIFKPLSSNDE